MNPGGPTEKTLSQALADQNLSASNTDKPLPPHISISKPDSSNADNRSWSASASFGPNFKKNKSRTKLLQKQKPVFPANMQNQSVMDKLKGLMKDERYPNDPTYTQHVQTQFKKAFPGTVAHDETGQMRQPQPVIKPEEVEQFNAVKSLGQKKETDLEPNDGETPNGLKDVYEMGKVMERDQKLMEKAGNDAIPIADDSRKTKAPTQTEVDAASQKIPQGSSYKNKDKLLASLDEDMKDDYNGLQTLLEKGRQDGLNNASNLLEHYLHGDGSDITMDQNFVRKAPAVKIADQNTMNHFENWFTQTGESANDTHLGNIKDWFKTKEKKFSLKGMIWESVGPTDFTTRTDENMSFGGATVKGKVIDGGLKRNSEDKNVINVDSVVEFHAEDDYTFDNDKGWFKRRMPLPQSVYAGEVLTRKSIGKLEKIGVVSPFNIYSTPWKRRVTGTIEVKNGKLIKKLQWSEVK